MLGDKLTNVWYKHLNVAPHSQPTNRVVGLLRPPCGLLPPFPSVVHKLFWRADVREYSACSVTYGVAFSLTNAPPYLPYSMCMAIQVSVQKAQLFRMKSRYDFINCVSRVRVQWLSNGKKSIVAFTAVVYARVCLSLVACFPSYILYIRVTCDAPFTCECARASIYMHNSRTYPCLYTHWHTRVCADDELWRPIESHRRHRSLSAWLPTRVPSFRNNLFVGALGMREKNVSFYDWF